MRSSISQLSIHKLEVFCLVAELSSVSQAAEKLGLAQPVVSSHIKALSKKLGVKLTQREGRKISLTQDGVRVHRLCREMVNLARDLEQELVQSKRGLIGDACIGTSLTLGSYILPTLISRFHKTMPGGAVSVFEATPEKIVSSVRDGSCDFAFTILGSRLEYADLLIKPVGYEELVLAVSPKLSASARMTAGQISELPFVTAQKGTPRREIEEELLARYFVRRSRIHLEFGHAEAMKRAVRAGVGGAFLFRSSVQDELAQGSLKLIDTPGMELKVPIFQVCRKQQNLSAYQIKLMQYVSGEIKSA